MNVQLDNMTDRELLVHVVTKFDTMFPDGQPKCLVHANQLDRIEKWAKGLGVAIVTIVGTILGRIWYGG